MQLRVDPTSGVPIHLQIEDQLDALVARGVLRPGDRLPPERDLAADLGVSRMTLRQALASLAARGVLDRGVGRGTFVAEPKVEHDHRRVAGFTAQMEAAGLEPGARVLRAALEPAPEALARTLGVDRGAPLAHVARLRAGGGEPLTLEDSWVPAERFPGLLDRDLSGSLYALMSAIDPRFAPVRAVERLEPVLARPDEARALGVRPRSALMLVERTAHAAGGTPVEHARDRHRGDRARFVVEVATGVAASG
jgi:GntR family transcriptional regulator